MDFNNFAKRFNVVLQGRRANPWAKKMGFSSGTASRMMESIVPGQDVLTGMMRADNVNISWLLGASGNPFMIDTYVFAPAFLNQAKLHLDDQNYDVYMLQDEHVGVSALVFTQPASYVFKKTTVYYHQIECLACPYTDRLTGFIDDVVNHGQHQVFFPRLGDVELRSFVAGQLGTYTLLGDDTKTGLLKR